MATEKRLIDANALRTDFLKKHRITDTEFDICSPWWKFSQAIANAPTVDAVEVVHGRWYRTGAENVYGGIEIQCSECGHTFMTSPGHIEEEHFCCNCGAKMDGDGDE